MTILDKIIAESLRANDYGRMLADPSEEDTTLHNITSNSTTAPDDSTPLPDTNVPATDSPSELPSTETPTPTGTEVPATDASTSDVTATPDAMTETRAVTTEPTGTAITKEPTTSVDVVTRIPSSAPTSFGQLREVGAWEQCGGFGFDYTKDFADKISTNWSTKLSCTPGYSCEVVNPWYYQCQPVADANSVELWSQCGGVNYERLTTCVNDSVCNYENDLYSQSIPEQNA